MDSSDDNIGFGRVDRVQQDLLVCFHFLIINRNTINLDYATNETS